MPDISQNPVNPLRRNVFVASGLAVAALVIVSLFNSPAVHAQLENWKFIPTPERYTELYFDHNVTLPTTVTGKPEIFAFSIHNAENQETIYPYTVTLVSTTGVAQPLGHGTVDLIDGGTATVPEAIALPKGTVGGEISIELPNQQQEIHFWLGVKK